MFVAGGGMGKTGSLLEYAKEVGGVRTVELLDPDVSLLAPGLCLEATDANGLYNILSLIYHSEDIEVEGRPHVDGGKAGRKARYFCDTTVCFNCGDMGHEAKECMKASGRGVCELCSWPGHGRAFCPYRLCSRCWKAGHSAKECREPVGQDPMCMACPVGSHRVTECPKAWKRYKLCRRAGRRAIQKACPCCLSKTHFVGDCGEGAGTSIFNLSCIRLAQFYSKQ